MYFFRKTLKISQFTKKNEILKEYEQLKKLEATFSIAMYENSIFLPLKNQMILVYDYCEVYFQNSIFMLFKLKKNF